ncbi:MAG: phage tail protein [Deltaproteobacteria bacterium]|nr:phage tail protein [Deltaproteobacteria bacterium]
MLGVTNNEYPPVGFYFKVVLAVSGGLCDTSFKSVSGISSEIETEEVTEGGENGFKLLLPKKVKHPRLVLKRGIADITSPLVIWCKSVLETEFITAIIPMPLLTYLMDEKGIPLRAWSFSNAYPVKWEVDAFDSMKNNVAIETIELAYNSVNRLL